MIQSNTPKIPKDLIDIIFDIIAHKSKENQENYKKRERLYIDDYYPDVPIQNDKVQIDMI